MKSLIIIWLTVLIVGVGGSAYMVHEINGMIERVPENVVTDSTPVTFSRFNTEGLELVSPVTYLSAVNSDPQIKLNKDVVSVKSDIMTVTTSNELQTAQNSSEDEYTPGQAAQGGAYNPQTTRHAYFLQDATADPQPAKADLRL